jgi:hypothetical protein
MQLTKKHHEFLSYLFTLQFLKSRFKDFDKDNNFIFIPSTTLNTMFFPKPTFEIDKLSENGFIQIKEQITESGYPIKLMRTKGVHNLNFSNFEYSGAKLDDVTIKMRSYLKHISLPENFSSNLYFDKFLEVKDYNIECFFKVDHFSGRVHTPVTSLPSEFRSQLLVKGEETVSLDVVTMQPLLLGKILEDKISYNQYSYWIDEGEDIYIRLMQTAKLNDREAAKTKDKDAKLFAKNIRIQIKGLPADGAVQKNDLKMQIKTMAIEKHKEIAKMNEKIAKKEKFTRKLKQLLERKYKKSVKDRAKAEKDIANDVAEIDEESGELKKKVKEIHDLADIEDDELREFVKAKTQEFVEGLSKQ